MTSLVSGAATDVGQVRHNNEDSYLVREGLFVVADGMGGHRGGEVASKIAVETLASSYDEPTVDGLVEAIEQANSAVYEKATDDPELAGMGTTLTVLAPIDEGDEELLALANVGDSRGYLIRDGVLEQITEDHSLVAEMERDGRITSEEAAIHPNRNIVTRALGIDPQVAVDTFTIVPYEGDRFLLCSDGLYDAVEDDRIAATLRRLSDPTDSARELVRLANEGGGRDNITVIVVDVVDDDGRAAAASAALAADSTTTKSHEDMAGFTTATSAADAKAKAIDEEAVAKSSRADKRASRKQAKAERRAARPRRFTWRVAIFAVLFLAILAGAAGAVWMQARNTYFVGFADDEVAIFRGRPGGVLWINPTFEEATGIRRSQVPANRRDDLIDGHQAGTVSEARRYVATLQEQIDQLNRRATTTTTTTTTTTSTTSSTTTTSTSVVPGN